MGTLTYDVVKKVHFDDRLLAHLQLVIATKLRRGESFNFSWKTDTSEGGGRSTIWLHPAIPLLYEYQGSKQPTINRTWLDELMAAADTTIGLQVIPEPRETRSPRADEPLRASAL